MLQALKEYYKIKELNPPENIIPLLYNFITKDIILDINDEEYNHYIGLYYHINEKYPEMLKYYKKSKLAKTYHNLGCYFNKINNIQNMLYYYKKASDMDYSNSSINLSIYYQKNLDFDNMDTYLSMAMAKDSKHLGRCMCIYGSFYQDIKDYPVAIKYHNIAIKYNYYDAYLQLAYTYKLIHDFDKMIESYLKGIQYNIDDCAHDLAVYYKDINEYTLAEHYFKISLTNPKYVYSLCNLYYITEQFDKMIEYIELYKDKINLVTLGKLKNLLGIYRNNIELLEESFKINNDIFTAINCGRYYLQHGQYEKLAEYIPFLEENSNEQDAYCLCLLYYLHNNNNILPLVLKHNHNDAITQYAILLYFNNKTDSISKEDFLVLKNGHGIKYFKNNYQGGYIELFSYNIPLNTIAEIYSTAIANISKKYDQYNQNIFGILCKLKIPRSIISKCIMRFLFFK